MYKTLSGEYCLKAENSTIRTKKDNFIVSELGNSGVLGFSSVFIEAGIVDDSRNKDAVLRIFSQNLSFIGGVNKTHLFSREDMTLSSLKNIFMFSGGKLYKNKEFEQGGNYIGGEINARVGRIDKPDPKLPVKFIECPPGNWKPTKQNNRCD